MVCKPKPHKLRLMRFKLFKQNHRTMDSIKLQDLQTFVEKEVISVTIANT